MCIRDRDRDYPELSATFAVSAAGDNRTREYSLNVAAEDVTAVSGQTGEKSEIDYALSLIHIYSDGSCRLFFQGEAYGKDVGIAAVNVFDPVYLIRMNGRKNR